MSLIISFAVMGLVFLALLGAMWGFCIHAAGEGVTNLWEKNV